MFTQEHICLATKEFTNWVSKRSFEDLYTVNVLKFQTLVAYHKGLDKRPRSEHGNPLEFKKMLLKIRVRGKKSDLQHIFFILGLTNISLRKVIEILEHLP